MTKSELEQIYYLNRELKMWEDELSRIRARSLVQSPSGSSSHGSGMSDKVAQRGERVVELERKVSERKALIREVKEFIRNIPDCLTRMIVENHCMKDKDWGEILDIVGGKKNTEDSIQKRYYRFLKETFG